MTHDITGWFCQCGHAEMDHSRVEVAENELEFPCDVPKCFCSNYQEEDYSADYETVQMRIDDDDTSE
jgi:hypothetical protein